MSAIESINFYLFDPNLNMEKSIQTTISAPTQFKGLKYRFTFSYNSFLKIFLGFFEIPFILPTFLLPCRHKFYAEKCFILHLSIRNAKPFLINPLIDQVVMYKIFDPYFR